MQGFLPIKSISELQDWEQSGYFYNSNYSPILSGSTNLIPFISSVLNATATPSITSFKLLELKINGSDKRILSETTLDHTKILPSNKAEDEDTQKLYVPELIAFGGLTKTYVTLPENSIINIGDEYVASEFDSLLNTTYTIHEQLVTPEGVQENIRRIEKEGVDVPFNINWFAYSPSGFFTRVEATPTPTTQKDNIVYYYDGETDLATIAGFDDGFPLGTYELYFKDSDDNEYLSDVFEIVRCIGEEAAGDFSGDFSDDFLIQHAVVEVFTRIECSDLPSYFPTSAFKDITFADRRVVKTGTLDETFVTSDKFATIDLDQEKEQVIQKLLFNRYELSIYATESENIQQIKHCETVNIFLGNGDTHNAKIINLSQGERQGNTNFLKYVLEYADVNPDNYINGVQPINNFMIKEELLTKYTEGNLNKLVIIATSTIDSTFSALGNNYTFYSKLVPKITIPTVQAESDEVAGLIIESRQIAQDAQTFRCYLSGADAAIAAKYIRMCSLRQLWIGSSKVEAIDAVHIPRIKKIDRAVDLYEVEVDVMTNNIIYNAFN